MATKKSGTSKPRKSTTKKATAKGDSTPKKGKISTPYNMADRGKCPLEVIKAQHGGRSKVVCVVDDSVNVAELGLKEITERTQRTQVVDTFGDGARTLGQVPETSTALRKQPFLTLEEAKSLGPVIWTPLSGRFYDKYLTGRMYKSGEAMTCLAKNRGGEARQFIVPMATYIELDKHE